MVNSFHSLDQPYKVVKGFNDFGSKWDCGLVVTETLEVKQNSQGLLSTSSPTMARTKCFKSKVQKPSTHFTLLTAET